MSDNTDDETAADPTRPPEAKPAGAGGTPPTPPLSPGAKTPFPPGTSPQLIATSLGFQVSQPQQSPEVVKEICNYLSHDSDNRLQWFEERSKRGHTFRMWVLGAVTFLTTLILAIPLIALWRGDTVFVSNFFDRYFQTIIIVVLALLGGGKLFDLLR